MAFNHAKMREQRIKLGLTQLQLAMRTITNINGKADMMNPIHLSNYETGRTQPGTKMLARLATALELSPAELDTDLAAVRPPQTP